MDFYSRNGRVSNKLYYKRWKYRRKNNKIEKIIIGEKNRENSNRRKHGFRSSSSSNMGEDKRKRKKRV